MGHTIRQLLAEQGGVEALSGQLHAVTAYHDNNYLPLLWPIHSHDRSALFRLLDLLQLESSTRDHRLLEALVVVRQHQGSRRSALAASVDVGFASQRWQAFVREDVNGKVFHGRRALELCVFMYLAEALQSGDVFVVSSGACADYRAQPLAWDAKLDDATRRNLFVVFGFGCNLGESQTARHAPEAIDRHSLRRINAQHVSVEKLEAALRDIIHEYARFDLPRFWGRPNVAIADGTHMELRGNNLLGEQHIRYGRYGGIAYHHISSTYIALFSNFIACGVWEAVYILDGLLQDRSDFAVDRVHADTHGQSEPVFGLPYLLGIKLLPRMRTWNDAVFYRPAKDIVYRHIDPLFSRTVGWELIETHWQDMMQVVLSIQAGKVLPSMLLRKLGSHSRQNRLYRAFRELGRVVRTLFLLSFVSEGDLRQSIRAETTKIESYNDFLDWIGFGGPILKSGDPIEQLKQVK
ncbi:Tn3 family transposase, partial [Thiorhodococcus minor]|nr:transposase [Thiorhodococcus minor]